MYSIEFKIILMAFKCILGEIVRQIGQHKDSMIKQYDHITCVCLNTDAFGMSYPTWSRVANSVKEEAVAPPAEVYLNSRSTRTG